MLTKPKRRYTPKARFQSHKGHAKDRDIPFEFTFEEWVAWWEKHLGPDWMNKRGCTSGKYVMARYNDVGSYCPANVKCILHVENLKETEGWKKSNKGEMNRKSKLTDADVQFIRSSPLSVTELLKLYPITYGVMYAIRRGEIWKHLLK